MASSEGSAEITGSTGRSRRLCKERAAVEDLCVHKIRVDASNPHLDRLPLKGRGEN
jgi:hypothetical protein